MSYSANSSGRCILNAIASTAPVSSYTIQEKCSSIFPRIVIPLMETFFNKNLGEALPNPQGSKLRENNTILSLILDTSTTVSKYTFFSKSSISHLFISVKNAFLKASILSASTVNPAA